MTRILPLILIASSLAGCAFLVGPQADSPLSDDLSLIIYPKDAGIGDDLDIIAVKRGNTLTLINRTPREYHDLQLWLNQQYLAKIDTIKIGKDNVVRLNECINEFGEPFPVGGILNMEKSYPVVLAELVPEGPADGADKLALAEGKRYRMVVRMDETSARDASGRSTEGDVSR